MIRYFPCELGILHYFFSYYNDFIHATGKVQWKADEQCNKMPFIVKIRNECETQTTYETRVWSRSVLIALLAL